MKVKTHILSANGQFDGLEEIIETTIKETFQKITSIMPIDNVDIVVSDFPRHIIPGYGLGGIAMTPYRVELYIDPKFPNIKAQIQNKFPQQIAHELHHCMRMRIFGKTKTLLEAIIQDGLADQFGIEVTGDKPDVWSIAVKGEELQKFLKIAEKEFNNPEYDHVKWFFSHNKGDIPHWAGYSLGFYLVGEYLKNYPESKPSKLYDVPAKNFVK